MPSYTHYVIDSDTNVVVGYAGSKPEADRQLGVYQRARKRCAHVSNKLPVDQYSVPARHNWFKRLIKRR